MKNIELWLPSFNSSRKYCVVILSYVILFANQFLNVGCKNEHTSSIDFESVHEFEQYFYKDLVSYVVSFDSTDAVVGKACMKIAYDSTKIKNSRFEGSGRPIFIHADLDCRTLGRGQLKVSCYIKSSDTNCKIFITADSKTKNLFEKYSINKGLPPGTWNLQELTCQIPDSVDNLGVGLYYHGSGSALIDGMSITFEGKDITPLKARFIDTLTVEQENMIRKNAIIIAPTEIYTQLKNDVGIRTLASETSIIGIGEATHGSNEFFNRKAEIIKFLVMECEYDHITLEANTSAASKVNAFIHGGKGYAKDLVCELDMRQWCTRELAELIDWLRDYNTKHQNSVSFTGMDVGGDYASLYSSLQKIVPSIVTTVDTFVTMDKKNLLQKLLKENANQEGGKVRTLDSLIEIVNRITQKETIDKSKFTGYWRDYRDSCMAVNLIWEANRLGSATKTLIWAHNWHISKNRGWLGSRLAFIYGAKYASIGFTFYTGNYKAMDLIRREWSNYSASTSVAGSMGFLLNTIGIPEFYLNFRTFTDPTAMLFFRFYFHDRSYGYFDSNDPYFLISPSESFDILYFIRDIKASESY